MQLFEQYPVAFWVGAASLAVGIFGQLVSLIGGGLTVNTCAGPVGAATAAVLATLALQQGNKLFVWHPIFMTASVLCFSAAAVDAIKRRKTAARDRRVSLSQLHWMLIDASAASMGVGMWAIYTVKNRPLDQHFTSLHSLVGLSALSLYALNLASGGYSTLGPLVSGKSMNLVWKDWTHRAVGTLAFTLATLSVVSGLYNKVVVLPEGWGNGFSLPANWKEPGRTWSYKNLGGKIGVFAFIGASVAVLALVSLPQKKTKTQ